MSDEVLCNSSRNDYIDIEQMVQDGVYWAVKQAYDYCRNPYFDNDGELITIPEAIDYLLPLAKKEAINNKENPDFATVFGDKAFEKIKSVDPEEDPYLSPAQTRRYGFSPAQVYFMKCAHEYYLAHIIMKDTGKTFKALQNSKYDVEYIFDLMKEKRHILDDNFPLSDVQSFAIDSVCEKDFFKK